jgi:FXSXX-COOH protein
LGEEIAVEIASEPKLRSGTGDEPKATAIIDVRHMPLETLLGDADVSAMVGRILDSMDGSSRVSVAMFNSAI